MFPYVNFSFKQMSFGLRNAPTTFQCWMLSNFLDMMEDSMEEFMNDISVVVKNLWGFLENMGKVLKRCV